MNSSINHHNPDNSNITIVDSHAHFWDLKQLNYPWLDQVPSIKRTFLPEDYTEQTKGIPIEKIVFVQSDCQFNQGLAEVDFITQLASEDNRIQAIVAYNPIDNILQALNGLNKLHMNPLVRGIRCMFDDSIRFLHPESIEVLKILPNYNYSFDVCIKFEELSSILKVIEQCPNTQFVIDHLAKPNIKAHSFSEFKAGIDQLASFSNVYAKISGLITEAGPNWTASHLEDYIGYAIEKFGFNRLMFGSNWPVVLLNGTFQRWYQVVENFLEFYSDEDKRKLFYLTASKFYRLEV